MPGRYRFSMPSNRGRSDPWFRAGTVDVTTTILIAATCVVFLFVYAASKTAINPFWLSPDKVTSGEVWRLVTWPFVDPRITVWTVITIAIFWYFGSQIEAELGRTRYLWLVGLTVIPPALLATLFDVGLAGIRPLELAIFVVFACQNPRVPFFFGVPAWIIAAVIVGIDVLQLIADRRSEELIVYVASISIAMLTARSFGLLDELTWLPKVAVPKRRRKASASRSSGAARGSSSVVVDGPWPTTPAYQPMQDQAEVDQILDKIALVGMEGLSADEKKRLNDASKRLRKQGH